MLLIYGFVGSKHVSSFQDLLTVLSDFSTAIRVVLFAIWRLATSLSFPFLFLFSAATGELASALHRLEPIAPEYRRYR